jgi:hypothetical protein
MRGNDKNFQFMCIYRIFLFKRFSINFSHLFLMNLLCLSIFTFQMEIFRNLIRMKNLNLRTTFKNIHITRNWHEKNLMKLFEMEF